MFLVNVKIYQTIADIPINLNKYIYLKPDDKENERIQVNNSSIENKNYFQINYTVQIISSILLTSLLGIIRQKIIHKKINKKVKSLNKIYTKGHKYMNDNPNSPAIRELKKYKQMIGKSNEYQPTLFLISKRKNEIVEKSIIVEKYKKYVYKKSIYYSCLFTFIHICIIFFFEIFIYKIYTNEFKIYFYKILCNLIISMIYFILLFRIMTPLFILNILDQADTNNNETSKRISQIFQTDIIKRSPAINRVKRETANKRALSLSNSPLKIYTKKSSLDMSIGPSNDSDNDVQLIETSNKIIYLKINREDKQYKFQIFQMVLLTIGIIFISCYFSSLVVYFYLNYIKILIILILLLLIFIALILLNNQLQIIKIVQDEKLWLTFAKNEEEIDSPFIENNSPLYDDQSEISDINIINKDQSEISDIDPNLDFLNPNVTIVQEEDSPSFIGRYSVKTTQY